MIEISDRSEMEERGDVGPPITVPLDSLGAVPPELSGERPDGRATPRPVGRTGAEGAAPRPAESSPPAAPGELAALAVTLVIPVRGVEPEALVDSYDEPRSGGRAHEALDIAAPRGTPVLSATAGRILKLHRSAAGGLMIYATDASERFILMYAHLERYAPGLAEGQALRRGQPIGEVGTSGNAPPDFPHLHFVVMRGDPGESWWRGTPVNPFPLLAR